MGKKSKLKRATLGTEREESKAKLTTGPKAREAIIPSPIESTAFTVHAAEKLVGFVRGRLQGIVEDAEYWLDEFSDGKRGEAENAAKRGVAEAQFVLGLLMATQTIPSDGKPYTFWLQKAMEKRMVSDSDPIYAEAVLGFVLTNTFHQFRVPAEVVQKRFQEFALGEASMANQWLLYLSQLKIHEDLRLLDSSGIRRHFITANYILGMLDQVRYGSARPKDDMLETARRFRLAAHEGLMEAQWELGEMFRQGLHCDVHMRFARKYIRRASKQGHTEAVERMKDMRRCACCGAEDAPRKCSWCLESRYCSSTCSSNHWAQGRGELDAPHKQTCSRLYRSGVYKLHT
jgi:TPR repeat protein